MADSTARGIVYAEAGDHTRLWDHFQATAESVDDALATPACKIINTNSQSGLGSGGSGTQLQFNTTLYDTDGIADLANNRLVIQTAGIYHVAASCRFSPGAGTRYALLLNVNGTTVQGKAGTTPAGTNGYTISDSFLLGSGDLVTINLFHASGINESTTAGWQNPSLSASWIGHNS